MRVRLTASGSFNKTDAFLSKMKRGDIFKTLEKYGQAGVAALASATPRESGLAANSWTYEIERGRGTYSITWLNTNIENGFPVAIMLQYGHGTGTGGWVAGRDYINPAIQPIFDKIADEVWRAVKSA